MNKIENKFLLAGDKFMPHMHLRSLELIVIKKVIKLLVILTVKKLSKWSIAKKSKRV